MIQYPSILCDLSEVYLSNAIQMLNKISNSIENYLREDIR